MYVTLETVKTHLNIDRDYIDDDEYITDLIDAATVAVENHIMHPLTDVITDDDELPSAIKHAIMLLVADFYNNRETTSYSAMKELPLSYSYLLQPYKDYSFKTSH